MCVPCRICMRCLANNREREHKKERERQKMGKKKWTQNSIYPRRNRNLFN